MSDVTLASVPVVSVIAFVVFAMAWYVLRRATRATRYGSMPGRRMKEPAEVVPGSEIARELPLGPGERAWEPLAVADWDHHLDAAREPDPSAADAALRWLVLTSRRILVVRQIDGHLDAEIRLGDVTRLGLAPLPQGAGRRRVGIAVQATGEAGPNRWLWCGEAAEAPGWVRKARELATDALG